MGKEGKKPEEAKKVEEEKVVKKEEPTNDEKPSDGKEEGNKNEEAPPPPPQDIILRVYLHCEGCAKKVRRCLKGFDGVEDVTTDCRTSRVVVKGEKADPIKVLERVQRKSYRQVDLLSPIPPPPPPPPPAAEEPKKPEETEEAKTEEKTEEPPTISVVLRVYMHCEACAQEIRKRIQRMRGVESAEPDLKNSEVTVRGAIEPEKLVDYVYKRTGKQAAIVKVEPNKKEEEKGKDDKEEKKPAEEGVNEAKKGEKGGGGGEEPPAKQDAEAEEPKMELKKNEFYQYYPQNYQVYPQRIVQDMYSYPPQIFSDENPNACSVM